MIRKKNTSRRRGDRQREQRVEDPLGVARA
jgi:hypothetical protein